MFATDDLFTILCFIVWQSDRNISGACIYIELILGCEYPEHNDENIAHELDQIDQFARHAFETIKTVSLIRRVPLEGFIDHL